MSSFNLDLNELTDRKVISIEYKNKETTKKDIKIIQKELQENRQSEEVPEDNSESVKNTKEMISVYDFIKLNIDKLSGCKILNMFFDGSKENEYILFQTIEVDKNIKSSVFLFDGCCDMWIKAFIPEKITVQVSGMIAESTTQKVFISKTNIFQFEIKDQMPIVLYKFKRCTKVENLTCEKENEKRKTMTIDIVKLKIKQVCPRLFNVIKEHEDKSLIKKDLMEFIDKTIDLNYLIKIYKDLLLIIDI